MLCPWRRACSDPARLRHVLRSQPRVKQPASRAARSTRRRMKGNFFAFVAAQVLIAVVAFIVVTDYIADGPIRHQVSNILTQVAGDGPDAKSDQDEVIAVTPPPRSMRPPTRKRPPFTRSRRHPSQWKNQPPKSRSRLQPLSHCRKPKSRQLAMLDSPARLPSQRKHRPPKSRSRLQQLNLRHRRKNPQQLPSFNRRPQRKRAKTWWRWRPFPILRHRQMLRRSATRRTHKTKASRWADDPRLRHVP